MVTTNHHKSSSTSRMRTTATTLFYIFILVLLLGDGFVGINAIQKTTPTAKKTSTTASTVIGGSGVPPTASESVNSAQQQHQQQQTKREAVNIEQQQQTHIINQNIQQQRRYYHHFRYSQELNTPSPQLSGIDGFPWPPNLSTSKQPSSSSSTSTTGTTASASASTSAHDDAVDGVNEEVEETIVFGETLDEDMIEKFVHDNKDKDKDKDNNSNKQKKEKDLNDNNSKKKSNNVDKQQQQQTKKSMNDNNNNNNNNPVSIFPLDLHFKNSQMCIDSKDSFVITNLKSHPIQILSIQTSSQHFETDFIRSFTLKDNENHRVRVVFKPRYIGEYNTTVQVHSVDQDSGLTYVSSIKVFGTAKGSFYQLSPISDRVLIDTMFSRSIYIYNPHNETLYIKDIYTSGAPFYLSLPPGSSTTSSDTPLPPSTTPSVTSSIPSTSSQKLKQQQQQQHESPQNNIWEIEPFTRGQIINLSFRSSLTGMFNNELHIDTNFANFTVYLQIQSIGETVHLSPESLDFGFITGKSDFKSVSLFLYNPEQEDINILEIRPLHPDPRLKFFIHDDSTTFAKSPSEIAHFFYSSELEGVFRGIILIRINGYKDTHIPYRAVVAHGDLSYNPKDVLFPLIPFGSGDIDMDFLDETQDEPYPRLSPTTLKDVASRPIVSKTTPGLYTNRLVLRNNFNVPLVIYSVHVSDNLFVVKDAPLGVSVKPHETWKPILLEINPNYKYNDRQLLGPGGKHASLYVDTNISVFEIDLHAYNRLLSFSTNLLDFETQPLSTFQERSIDFGVISRNEVRRRTFKLKNSNPFNLFITCVGHIQPPTNTNRFNIKTDGVRGIFGQDVVIINKSGTGRDTASGPSSSSSSSTPSSNSLSSKTLTADISMQLLSVYNDRGQFVHSGADFFGADHSLFDHPCVDLPKMVRARRNSKKNNYRITFEPVVVLPPGHTATFGLDVLTRSSYGRGERHLVIMTQYENMTLSYKWRVMNGSLSISPQVVDFGSDLTMHGTPVTRGLYANSTYNIAVNITSIDISDPRVTCVMLTNQLAPKGVTHFANLVFTPVDLADDDPEFTRALQELATSPTTDLHTVKVLTHEYIQRETLWRMRGGSLDVPANVAIHTDIVSHHAIKTSATLAKPNLFSSKDVNVDELRYPDPDVPAGAAFVAALALDFGMARINADVYRTVDIYNPLDIPIFAQLFDLDLESLVANYKIKHGIDKLENTNNCMDGEASTDDDEDKDGDNINNDSSDFIKRQQSHFHPLVLKKTKDQHSIYFDDIDKPAAQQAAGKQPSSSSSGRNKIFSLKRSGAENMMFIAPKSTVAFGPIKFHPLNYTSYNAIVYLKNNYTYLQPIFLTGHGGGGRLLVVDSDTHMSNSILLDLNKTHLSPCIFQRHNVEVDINSDILIDSKKVVNSQNTNRIEVSKSFTIVNTGNLILEIKDIFINDFKCNGFGFKVLNCNELKGLSINEGEMFKIQVSYEPDFSTSMLKKELVIKTNQESFGFNLIGTFPHEFLPLCTHLQPSFFYDYPAKVIFILSMVILFFMLILLSFIKPVGHKRKSLLQRIVARITATRIRWSTSVTTASLTAASGRELLTSGGGGVDSPTSSYHHGGSRDNHNHHHHISASVIPKSPDKSSSSSNEKNNNKTTVNKKERLTNRKIKSSNEDNSNSSRKNSSSSKSLNHNHHHHQQHQVMTTTTTTTTVLEEDKFEDSIVIQQQQEKEKDLLLAARSPLSESLDDISMSSHDNLGAILEDGVDNPTTPTEDLTPRSIDDEPTTTIVQQDHVEKIDASTITSTMTTKTTTIVISSTSLEDVVSNNNDKSKNEQQQHQQPSTSVVVVETIKQKHQQQKEDKPLLVVQADKKVAEVVVPSIQTVTSTTAPPSSASSKPQQKKKNTKHQQQQQQQQSLKISSDQSNDENVNTNKTNNHNHNGVNLNLSSSGSGSNIPIVASSSSSSTTDSSLTSTTPAYFGKKKYHKDNNSSAFLPANPPPPGSAKPVREPKKKYEKPQKQTTGKVVYVPKVPQPTTQPTTQQPPISTPTLQQPLPYSQQQQQQQNSVYLQYLQQQQQQQQKLQLQLQQQQQQQQSYSPFSNNGQFDYNPFISTSPPPQSTSSSSTSSNPSLLNTYNPFSFSPRPSTNNNNNTTTTTSPTSTSTSTLIQPSWFTNMNNLLAVDSSNNQQQQQQVMKSNTSPSHHQYHNNSLWRDQFGVIGSGKVSTTTSPNHTNNNSSSDLLMSSSATPSYRDLMPNTNLTSFLQQHSTVGTNTPINNNNNNSNNTSTTMTAGGVNPTTTTTTTVTNNNTTSGVYSPSYDLFANQMFGFSQPSSTQTTPTSVPSIANISTLTKFNLNHGYENGDDNDQQQQ